MQPEQATPFPPKRSRLENRVEKKRKKTQTFCYELEILRVEVAECLPSNWVLTGLSRADECCVLGPDVNKASGHIRNTFELLCTRKTNERYRVLRVHPKASLLQLFYPPAEVLSILTRKQREHPLLRQRRHR